MLRHQIKKMRALQSNRLEESPPVADFEEEAAHKAFETMLIEQRQTITELKKKLQEAERMLHVQHQEDKDKRAQMGRESQIIREKDTSTW